MSYRTTGSGSADRMLQGAKAPPAPKKGEGKMKKKVTGTIGDMADGLYGSPAAGKGTPPKSNVAPPRVPMGEGPSNGATVNNPVNNGSSL